MHAYYRGLSLIHACFAYIVSFSHGIKLDILTSIHLDSKTVSP